MGLFDLLSGWTAWAPFTFVIVGCMGFVMGWITEKKQGFQWYVVAMLAACAIKIGGYYIAEGIIYGNWITPVTSIPGNLLQIGTAAVSYTHLDVYKRQKFLYPADCAGGCGTRNGVFLKTCLLYTSN